MMIRCRINAAYNFPAMALLFSGVEETQPPKASPSIADKNSSSSSANDPRLQIGSHLLTSLSTLCKDARPEVRRRVAAGFHEVAKCLKHVDDSELDLHHHHHQRRLSSASSSPSAVRHGAFFAESCSNNSWAAGSLFDSLVYLLFDESLGVLRGLFKHLDISLRILADKYLAKSDGSYYMDDDDDAEEGGRDNAADAAAALATRTQLRQMLFAGLVQSEETVYNSYDWRLQADVFEKWASFLPIWFSSDQIFFNVVPFLFDKIRDSRPLPGKQELFWCCFDAVN